MNVVEPIKDKNDIKRIKKVLKSNERNLLLFNLGINSGLRISDILALDIKDVKNRDFIEIREKKTNKYKRFLLNEKLQKEINKYVKTKRIDELLFLTKRGKRLDRIQAYKILNNAGKEAGVKTKIGTHTLRKTFGYHHFKKFKNLPLLPKILNHSSSEITLIYIGITQENIDETYKNFYL